MEEWKILNFKDGYHNFMVSNLGRVKNVKKGTILKADISRGYHRVNLYNPITKKQKKFSIHRLVAIHFINGDTSLDVNHIDGNKSNNCVANLEWVTASENNKHAFRTNLRSQNGIKNPSNVYTENQIHHICRLIELNLSTRDISINVFGEFSLKYKNLINHIKGKRRWNDISKFYNF